ncbi:MFS transporter [Nocardia terpenica]|uniref:MFS transporter n=1 Tax=Nocardia terpenica TaxID=455432 RepID=A0A291RS02_9NOCA|nr:MFS transporter [Nocardia terpenica]
MRCRRCVEPVSTRTRAISISPLLSLGLGSGTMLQALNSSMIAIAMVGISREFAGEAGLSWIIPALYIATAGAGPTAGKLAEIYGPRRVFLSGLLIVLAGSLIGGLATGSTMIVVARVLQGIGTASQLPTAMMIVRGVAARRNVGFRPAVTILTICAQSMVALGPSIGGFLVSAFDWRSIFWVNVPLVVITAVWVMAVAPKDERADETDRGPAALDVPGVAVFVLFIGCLTYFLLSVPSDPAWPLLPVSLVFLVLFVVRELRCGNPFIDVRLLARNAPLCWTLFRTLATYTAFYGIFFGLPRWLQSVHGYSSGSAGLIMLPIAGIGIVSTMFVSRFYTRLGPRRTVVLGAITLIVNGVVLLFLETPATPMAIGLIVSAILGIPSGFNNIGNQHILNDVTTDRETGVAIGIYRTIQYLGANLAAILLTLLAAPNAHGAVSIRSLAVAIAIIGAALLVITPLAFSRTRQSR